MQIKHSSTIKGFTLMELLIYIAGLLALGTVMIVLIVQFYTLYKEIIAVPRADRVGLSLVDQITKEVRSADQIDAFNSQFGTTTGVLDVDSVLNGVTTSKKFSVQNGRVMFQDGASTAVSISPKDLYVSNFNFTLVTTPISEAVRFNLELQFRTRNATETKAYTGFAILRESYD
jgi:hypothetical protein